MHIRMGSRGSALAWNQCEQVRQILQEAYPQHTFEICTITTAGDRNLYTPLDQMQDKGIFVREIEQRLLDQSIDMAVHSMKDMPSKLDERLCFTKTLRREDARDVLVLRTAASLQDLPAHARIATGSRRRKFQLLKQRADLEIVGIRGNVETRLQKMEEQQLDGIVLAAAGLKRLGLADRITQVLDEALMVPAVAQGALAVEIRRDRSDLLSMINALSDDARDREVQIERAFLQIMDGGCHTPIGARCHITEHAAELYAVYGNEDGSWLQQIHLRNEASKAEELAQTAAIILQGKERNIL